MKDTLGTPQIYGGLCTGCGAWINSGPYFKRRVRRHLNDWKAHNHDAVEIIYVDTDGMRGMP